MPRRISGEQFVFAFMGNDYSIHFAKTDNPNLRSDFFNLIIRFFKKGKFASSKGKFFGQCIKIGYDVLYECFSAVVSSGTHNGTVGRLVNTKMHVSQCPKEGKFLFNIVGGLSSLYKPINRKRVEHSSSLVTLLETELDFIAFLFMILIMKN
jgi:hypothetical protein